MQVRDEFRQDYDAGRVDPMLDVYSEGMGPHGGLRVGNKRQRYSEAANGSHKRAAFNEDSRAAAPQGTGCTAAMQSRQCANLLD